MRCDLFSLGCLMYYTLTLGKHPYDPIDKREAKIRAGKPPNLSALPPSFPEAAHLIGCYLGTCTCGGDVW